MIAHSSGRWEERKTDAGVPAGPVDMQFAAPTPGWTWHMTSGIEWSQLHFGVVADPIAEGAASYTLDAKDVPAGGLDIAVGPRTLGVSTTAPFPEADLLYMHAVVAPDGGEYQE